MPARVEGVDRFFRGLFDPKALAQSDAEAAGATPVFDDRGLRVKAGASLDRANRIDVNPHDSTLYMKSREDLAKALGAMGAAKPSVSAAAGDAAQMQASRQQANAVGQARGGAERMAALEAGGDLRAQTAESAGSAAAQEATSDQSAYSQGLSGIATMDLAEDEAARRDSLAARKLKAEETSYYTSMLDHLDAAAQDAQIDYEALVSKLEKEARESSFATLAAIVGTIGAVAASVATMGGATPALVAAIGAAGAAGSGGLKLAGGR